MVVHIIVATATVSLYCMNNRERLERFLFVPSQMQDPKQWYRFITHGFIHADLPHLIFNMLSLYFMGNSAEYIFIFQKGPGLGKIYFVLFYLSTMIIASLPSWYKHRNNPGYRSLGASGAVAGVLFFTIMFMPVATLEFMILPIRMWAWVYGVIYLVSEYYLDKRQYGRVAHDVHFWGAVFGIGFAVFFYPQVLPDFFNQIAGVLAQYF